MKRRLIIFLLFLAVVIAVYFAARPYVSLDALIAQEERLRQLIDAAPFLSLLSGLAAYTITSLVPGTAGKCLVFGWLFGFWAGLVVVNVGLTVAALIVFLVIRYVFQIYIHRRFGSVIYRIDEALRRDGGIYLLTLRLLHAPYTLTNYTVAATTAPVKTFWWTTQLGMLPGNITCVLAGSQAPSLKQLVEEGPWSLINVPLLIGLSLAALLPVAIRTIIRRWKGRAIDDAQELTAKSKESERAE